MSINQYTADLHEAYWWTQQQHIMESSSKHNNFVSQFYHPTTNKPTATADMFCSQNTALGFNLNEEEEELDEQLADERENHSKEELQEHEIPKEALFEKPLTPSDVGKLNRLLGNCNENEEHVFCPEYVMAMISCPPCGQDKIHLGYNLKFGLHIKFENLGWDNDVLLLSYLRRWVHQVVANPDYMRYRLLPKVPQQ
ncbi:TF-B3 domain-containing protein [Forsythia ovata]|uniref:TF-B3 domain-containing protein n=1 Tax=Forsythia ovata TaxID=205694 RepID=A0ABD1NZ99_9LAMI